MSLLLRAVRFLLRGTAVVAAAGMAVLGVAYLAGAWWIARAEPDAAASPAGIPGRLIPVGPHPVHVVERGSGPPLLLVHGFAGQTYDWEEHVLEPLARHRRAIAVDLWGMGFSARDDAIAYGLDAWSDQLRGTLDALGIERAAVAGHSMGGAVAAAFAAAHPERVEGLVLVAPLVPLEERERALFFRILAVPGAGEALLGWRDHLPALPGFSDAYHERARAAFRIRGTRRALLRWVRQGYDPDRLAAIYRHIGVPTLVVAGQRDDIVPWAAVARTAATIDAALVRPVQDGGHWLLRDRPAEVVAAVTAFLDSGGRLAPAADAPLSSPP